MCDAFLLFHSHVALFLSVHPHEQGNMHIILAGVQDFRMLQGLCQSQRIPEVQPDNWL